MGFGGNATSITWTDTAPRELTNSKPKPADIFANWTPITGANESAVFTIPGTRSRWSFASYKGATFDLPMIPATDMDMVMRLLRHLAEGESVTVNTGDRSNRSYTCVAWPGWTIPEGAEFTDKQRLEYTLTLKLRNTGTADMVCLYGTDSAIS